MPATNKAFTTEDTESTEEYPIVFLSDLRVLGNCSCVALPPVTHMDVGNAKAMLEHRWPSVQSSVIRLFSFDTGRGHGPLLHSIDSVLK